MGRRCSDEEHRKILQTVHLSCLAADGEGVDGDLVVSRVRLLYARHKPVERRRKSDAETVVSKLLRLKCSPKFVKPLS